MVASKKLNDELALLEADMCDSINGQLDQNELKAVIINIMIV